MKDREYSVLLISGIALLVAFAVVQVFSAWRLSVERGREAFWGIMIAWMFVLQMVVAVRLGRLIALGKRQ